MKRQHSFKPGWALLALTLLLVGCQKKCQPEGEALRTFVDQEFRLVSSTDPQVKDLTNTNFQIMVFKVDFKGQIFRVENNTKYDSPAALFAYNVDPKKQILQIQYYKPPTEEAPGDGTFGDKIGAVHTYRYELGKDFRLKEEGTPNSYRYVRFTGVVRPDEVCSF